MNRLKFRAWDKERKEMRDIQLMDFSEWWVSTASSCDRINNDFVYGERNSFQNQETDRHIIMQSTGLKATNDKLIFEGDILQVKYKQFERVMRPTVGEVAYENGTYYITTEYMNVGGLLITSPMCKYYDIDPIDDGISDVNIIIVGNIYEHPNLLKEKPELLEV